MDKSSFISRNDIVKTLFRVKITLELAMAQCTMMSIVDSNPP